MSVYEQLAAKNPHLDIHELTDANYTPYGCLLSTEPYEQLFSALAETPIPPTGNVYVPSAPELESKSALISISQGHYGGEKAQIGYCNGNSHKINCMEYHDHEEIDLAGTDMVLFLGRIEDMEGLTVSTDKLTCFFVPAGTVLTFRTGTLHFAPCRVHRSGFRCGVVLQKGANAPIAPEKRRGAYFAQNKWLIGHAESRQVLEMHALHGLFGENHQVYPID